LKLEEKIEESYNLRLAREYRNVVLECGELNFDYLFWESIGDVLKRSASNKCAKDKDIVVYLLLNNFPLHLWEE
jgi:hypothetical protein